MMLYGTSPIPATQEAAIRVAEALDHDLAVVASAEERAAEATRALARLGDEPPAVSVAAYWDTRYGIHKLRQVAREDLAHRTEEAHALRTALARRWGWSP